MSIEPIEPIEPIESESRGFFFDRFFFDEQGNVESALVLLPLMILVLSILQIGMGVLNREVGSTSVQSVVNKSSLFSPSGRDPLILMGSQGLTEVSAIPLTGGGELYLGKRVDTSPSLTPLLPGGDSFTSSGIAIGENP